MAVVEVILNNPVSIPKEAIHDADDLRHVISRLNNESVKQVLAPGKHKISPDEHDELEVFADGSGTLTTDSGKQSLTEQSPIFLVQENGDMWIVLGMIALVNSPLSTSSNV